MGGGKKLNGVKPDWVVLKKEFLFYKTIGVSRK